MIYILHFAKDSVTHACVQSLLGQGEIVVIDNGSPVAYQPLTTEGVLRLPANLFLIPAFNEAMRTYPDSWYLCLNNDTIATPGMVARLLQALNDNADYGIVAPGTSDHQAGVLYTPYANPNLPDVIANHVDNHAWMFPQDLIDEIGYPDAEGHTHRACWYANRLYCYQARQAGYKVAAVRSAWIDHKHANGYDAAADNAGREWIEQRLGERVMEAL